MIRRRALAMFSSRWRVALLLLLFAGCAVVSDAIGKALARMGGSCPATDIAPRSVPLHEFVE